MPEFKRGMRVITKLVRGEALLLLGRKDGKLHYRAVKVIPLDEAARKYLEDCPIEAYHIKNFRPATMLEKVMYS